ncbi:MAG: redox-sensitive transcriptional activator SoxR [Gammaproteobacteria bacterium]
MKKTKAKSSFENELSVGEVAARSGVAVSAIQFYESKGLIIGKRTTGRRRRYPREVLKRLAVIRTAQSVGIPLSSVHDILMSLPNERTASTEDWSALLDHWRADVDERIAQLHTLRGELAHCAVCGCLLPEVCPLVAPEADE